MAAISRVQAVFSGSAVVGPAASAVFTTGQVENLRNPWIDFWEVCAGVMPPSLTITIPATGETYDDATGELQEIWAAGTTAVIPGSASQPHFARGVGGRVVWNTQGLTNNRKVKGSTFIIPIAGSFYDTDGTLNAGTVSGIAAAAQAFVVATVTDFVVWTRPVNGAGGKSSGVVSSAFPDKISTLRSRRV